MHIIAVGLNYRTAPVEVREKFAFAVEELPKALNQLLQTDSIMECVIVATCNRTELYAVVDRHHLCGHYIRTFMEQWFGVSRQQFTHYLYMYEDSQAIEHLFRVSCGLDSMVIGETQILGQIRDAFTLAMQHKTTGTIFNMLFKQAVTLAKRAHTDTMIGEAAVSVSYAAVELGKRIFGKFNRKKVMVIGAGETSELTARHLASNGVNDIVVVNRTLERACQLAEKLGGQAASFDELTEKLESVDIVISSAGAGKYVLERRQVQEAMRRRQSRPLFLIDIAVPRNLEPTIAEIDNVFLYDIDDLEGIVESNLEQRKSEARKIEAMITSEMDEFAHWYKTLGVVPLIKALQTKAAEVHEETFASMTSKLPDLDEHELKVIRKLTKSMVNQMVQEPILRIKELAADKKADEAMALFAKLFALEDQVDEVHRHSPGLQDMQQQQEAPATIGYKLQSVGSGSRVPAAQSVAVLARSGR